MSGINHLQMEGYGIGLTTIVVSPILVGETKHWERPNQPVLLARHPPIRRTSCSHLPLLGQVVKTAMR